jgi:hypothetical protein
MRNAARRRADAAESALTEARARESRLREAVEGLADEWEKSSGLSSGFSYADLEKASQSERTLWEAADELRGVISAEPPTREQVADVLYRMNGWAWYGRDLGPFDGHAMEGERHKWLGRADHLRAVLAGVAEQEAGEACSHLDHDVHPLTGARMGSFVPSGHEGKTWEPCHAPSGADDTKGGE